MAKFNKGPMKKEMRDHMLMGMEKILAKSRNYCLQEELDIFFLEQLPLEVRSRIMTEFLYRDFFYGFRRYFNFRRVETGHQGMNMLMKFLKQKETEGWRQYANYPFYQNQDANYQEFITGLV